jgi:hypothetical protein
VYMGVSDGVHGSTRLYVYMGVRDGVRGGRRQCAGGRRQCAWGRILHVYMGVRDGQETVLMGQETACVSGGKRWDIGLY